MRSVGADLCGLALGLLLLLSGTYAQASEGPTAPTVTCGNAVVETGEACDDGNLTAGDGCSAQCQAETASATCGDYLLSASEQCDDGNQLDYDGCSALCQDEDKAAACGNAILEVGEQCDDGNTANGDVCSAQCILTPKSAQIAMRRTLAPLGVGAGLIAAGAVLELPPLVGVGGATFLLGPALSRQAYLGPYAFNPRTQGVRSASNVIAVVGGSVFVLSSGVLITGLVQEFFTGNSDLIRVGAGGMLVGGGIVGVAGLGYLGCTAYDLIETKAATARVNRILSLPIKLRPKIPGYFRSSRDPQQGEQSVSFQPVLVQPLPNHPGTTVGLVLSLQ